MCREAGKVEGDRIRQQAIEEAEELKQKVCSLQIPGRKRKLPHLRSTCVLLQIVLQLITSLTCAVKGRKVCWFVVVHAACFDLDIISDKYALRLTVRYSVNQFTLHIELVVLPM